MCDTPRTDEYYRTKLGSYIPEYITPIDFARGLERENARLREALERFRGQFDNEGCTGTAEVALEHIQPNEQSHL